MVLTALGQGAAQSIGDAGALGVLLSAGTPRTEIPARLAAYEGLRKERTELIGRESHDQMMVPRERRKYARGESDV
jgi:salicylate hydroxylase